VITLSSRNRPGRERDPWPKGTSHQFPAFGALALTGSLRYRWAFPKLEQFRGSRDRPHRAVERFCGELERADDGTESNADLAVWNGGVDQ